MDDLDLDAIRALVEAAEEGSWETWSRHFVSLVPQLVARIEELEGALDLIFAAEKVWGPMSSPGPLLNAVHAARVVRGPSPESSHE